MDSINYKELSDRDLFISLFENSIDQIKFETISDIFAHLPTIPVVRHKLLLVKEIASRYHNEELKPGVAFNCASQVFAHFNQKLSSEMQEHFFVIFLDTKNRVIKEKLIFLGTLNQSIVHPREIFAAAIEHRASSIIIAHNHPSGDSNPSNQDISVTKRLVDVGEIVGIKILDHVIIGHNNFFSFVDENLMP